MTRFEFFVGVAGLLLAIVSTVSAEEVVFSGPQVGEPLPSFESSLVFGDDAGKSVDVVQNADGQPLVLVFFHQRTRPAFGLMRAIMQYAATRADDGLRNAVVFLTDDATGTEQWLKVVRRNLADQITYTVFKEGIEGPGAYGLNRNVTLTVLVSDGKQVTANFALVQPSLQVDGPQILSTVVEVLGGGDVPEVADLAMARGRRMQKRGSRDPELGRKVRAVIAKGASPEAVRKAVKSVDDYVATHEAARQQLGEIAARLVKSGRLANYGTKDAQQQIRAWAEKYSAANLSESSTEDSRQEPQESQPK